MTLTPDELAERVAERYDPDMIVEILGISSKQLIDAFLKNLLIKDTSLKMKKKLTRRSNLYAKEGTT